MHTKTTNVLIVGAGGTAQFIIAALVNFQDIKISVIDADKFEEKNKSRQWLSRTCKPNTPKVQAICDLWPHIAGYERWYDGQVVDELDGIDSPEIVIAAVDNHATRQQLYQACVQAGVALILPGNEDNWGTCYTYNPALRDIGNPQAIDPFEYDPSLHTEAGLHPAHNSEGIHCDSGATLSETPQFAIANMTAAVLTVRHVLTYKNASYRFVDGMTGKLPRIPLEEVMMHVHARSTFTQARITTQTFSQLIEEAEKAATAVPA